MAASRVQTLRGQKQNNPSSSNESVVLDNNGLMHERLITLAAAESAIETSRQPSPPPRQTSPSAKRPMRSPKPTAILDDETEDDADVSYSGEKRPRLEEEPDRVDLFNEKLKNDNASMAIFRIRTIISYLEDIHAFCMEIHDRVLSLPRYSARFSMFDRFNIFSLVNYFHHVIEVIEKHDNPNTKFRTEEDKKNNLTLYCRFISHSFVEIMKKSIFSAIEKDKRELKVIQQDELTEPFIDEYYEKVIELFKTIHLCWN